MIPFNDPTFLGEEIEHVQKAILVNKKLSGNGPFTQESNKVLEEYLNVSKSLLTPSCTASLEMSALLLSIKEGDEIICPAYTFVTTISSFVLRGAKAIFVDIRSDTLNIDETKIEDAITSKTKAISVVHYAGVPCEMDAIWAIAKKHSLHIIEDAAQALGSAYKGRKCGTFGDLGCFSFHETKNIVCGEGGALIINNESLIEKAEIIQEKGTNRNKFFRGEVDKYTWVDVGSSFLLSDLNAAYVYPQLKNIDHINAVRLSIWNQYYKAFEKFQGDRLIKLPFIPDQCLHNGHMFYIVFNRHDVRTKYINYMKSKDIVTVFHYTPLHNSKAGLVYGRPHGDLSVTMNTSDRLVRLPLYYNMQKNDIDRVINETLLFLKSLS